MGTQIELFEAVDRAAWRQLSREAREEVVEMLAAVLLKYVEATFAPGSEQRDDR